MKVKEKCTYFMHVWFINIIMNFRNVVLSKNTLCQNFTTIKKKKVHKNNTLKQTCHYPSETYLWKKKCWLGLRICKTFSEDIQGSARLPLPAVCKSQLLESLSWRHSHRLTMQCLLHPSCWDPVLHCRMKWRHALVFTHQTEFAYCGYSGFKCS